MKMLDAFGAEGERWTQVMTIAREAGEKGWWESIRGIGERQALYADLEAGARQIREYQQTFVPGLLQIPEFVRARAAADAVVEPLDGTVGGVLEGRSGRQQMLRRPGAPGYEVIIDELAVRRPTAPPGVVKKQLLHLAAAGNGRPMQRSRRCARFGLALGCQLVVSAGGWAGYLSSPIMAGLGRVAGD